MTRMAPLRFLLSTALSLGLMISASYAQSEKKEEAPKSVLKKEETAAPKASPKKETAVAKWIEAENALIDPLAAKDKESIFILRNKHSVIRVIRVVERDIQNAVKSCAKENPDMKDQIEGRFKQWQDAVMPILDTAQKQLDKDVAAQTIVPVKDLKNVLKLNDQAYEDGEKQIKKQPVSTKEACESLIKSMDRTEDEMISLLQQTLLTESVIRSRAAKAKPAEDAKAPAAKGDKAE